MAPSEITRVTGISGLIPRELLTPKGTIALRRGAMPRTPMPKTTVDEDCDPSATENEIRLHPVGLTLGILSADPLLSSPPGLAFATENLRQRTLGVCLPLPHTIHRHQRTPRLPPINVGHFIRIIPQGSPRKSAPILGLPQTKGADLRRPLHEALTKS